MNSRIIFRILIALVIIGTLAVVGAYIYNAGVARGVMDQANLATPQGGAPLPYAYYPHFYRPWGFWFFPFGLIFGLFFIFIIFGVARRAFFGGWYRHGPGAWGGMSGHGPRDVPPMVEEWHRKMHEQTTNPPESS